MTKQREMNPPVVVNPSANAVLDAAYVGHNPNAATRAGRAAKRAKTSLDLHTSGGLVTIEEVGSQSIFATEAALAGVGGAAAALPAGAPAWAVAMNANLTAMNANMTAGFANINAKQSNAVASDGGDPIHPLTNNAGNQPLAAIFPNTFAELLALTNATNGPAHQLLLFYGLPANPSATRSLRLRKFLGAK